MENRRGFVESDAKSKRHPAIASVNKCDSV